MTWQEYEKLVFEDITQKYPNAKCEFNSHILGKYSNGLRQCDIIVRENIYGIERVTLIDAKYYSKKIDVKAVEDFIGMANDINADFGILITPLGYSELAYNRAENDPSKILLDILNLDDLKSAQGFCAIPFVGNNGVIITPPFGWIIDCASNLGVVASTYRKGFSFTQAYEERELIYFNFWNTERDKINKIELLNNQVELLREYSEILENTTETIIVNNKEITIRKTLIENYAAPEYGCAVEYKGFIFYGILLSPLNRESVNREKLIQVISQAIPLTIEHTSENKMKIRLTTPYKVNVGF
jgi:hypothetical protein